MVKPKTKKNIRAQRKFAQGAFIPAQNAVSQSPVLKHIRSTSAPPISGPVIQNNINPRDFLSRLSLERSHPHPEDIINYTFLQPSVHLLRITPTSEINKKKTKTKDKPSKLLSKKKYMLRHSQTALARGTRQVSFSDSGEENQPLINFSSTDRSDRLQTGGKVDTTESVEKRMKNQADVMITVHCPLPVDDMRYSAVETNEDVDGQTTSNSQQCERPSFTVSNAFSDWSMQNFVPPSVLPQYPDRLINPLCVMPSSKSSVSESILDDVSADPDYQMPDSPIRPRNIKKKPGRGGKRRRLLRGKTCDEATTSDIMQNNRSETPEHGPTASLATEAVFKRPNVPVRCVRPTKLQCAARHYSCLLTLFDSADQSRKDLCMACERCILIKKYKSVMSLLPVSGDDEPDVLDTPVSDVYEFDADDGGLLCVRRGRELVKNVLTTKRLFIWLCNLTMTLKKNMFIDEHKLGTLKRNLALSNDDDIICKVSSRIDYLRECLDEDKQEISSEVSRKKLRSVRASPVAAAVESVSRRKLRKKRRPRKTSDEPLVETDTSPDLPSNDKTPSEPSTSEPAVPVVPTDVSVAADRSSLDCAAPQPIVVLTPLEGVLDAGADKVQPARNMHHHSNTTVISPPPKNCAGWSTQVTCSASAIPTSVAEDTSAQGSYPTIVESATLPVYPTFRVNATLPIAAAVPAVATPFEAAACAPATTSRSYRRASYNPARRTQSRGRYPIPMEDSSELWDDMLVDDEEDLQYSSNGPSEPVTPLQPPTRGAVVDAPVYRPTLEEFQDPIAYIKKIEPKAAKYGMCKIIPPEGFHIPCHLDETVPFRTTNQYVGRLYQRWGPASRELAIIQIQVAMSEKFPNTKVPMFEGVEVDLVKLHRLVQAHGGLQELMEDKEKWATIAEEMSLVSLRGRADDKLQKIFMRHVLPYVSLTDEDRLSINATVDRVWAERLQKVTPRSRRPARDNRRSSGESVPSNGEEEPLKENPSMGAVRDISKPIFDRIEECTGKGRSMNMQMFRRVAGQLHALHFPNNPTPSVDEVEKAYWGIVSTGNEHVCVQTAAIDTSVNNLGHESDLSAPGGSHPWNLKRISANRRNILRSLGQSLSVTVPTLCLNQVFSTNCWHMDPHKLAWTDYMHQGSTKIWYSIGSRGGLTFRSACEVLVPAAVQNKGLWLPSDTAMVPLGMLINQACPLHRLEQNPGEYVVVFPGAYASSIATGLTVSESIYFEDEVWLYRINTIFQEMRDDCEPAMFSSAELLLRMAMDPNVDVSVLPRVYGLLKTIVDEEIAARAYARKQNFTFVRSRDRTLTTSTTWPYQEECTTCRVPLTLSKTHRSLDSRLYVCLAHGLGLFEEARRENPRVSPPELTLFLSDSELVGAIDALEHRLGYLHE